MVIACGSWPGAAHAPRSACYAGLKTRLAAPTCVNVWPGDNAKFRWPDLDASCDASSPVCDSPAAVIAKALRVADCGDVRIRAVREGDHLAKIRCEGDDSSELFINLDSLSCTPRNVRNYEPPRPGDGPRLASVISRSAGELIVEKAEAKMREIRQAVAEDTKVLLELTRTTPPAAFLASMRAGLAELNGLLREVQSRQNFDAHCEPPSLDTFMPDDKVRAQRTCRLLLSSSDVGRAMLEEAARPVAGPPAPDPERAQGDELAAKAGWVANSPLPYEQSKALSTRMLLFFALKRDHPTLPKELKLIRKSVETGAGDFWELHSGFVFGGRRLAGNSGGGYDCSDFMASIFIEHGRPAANLSTWELKQVARHLAGELREDRLSKSARALSSCFSVVDLRGGDEPQPGDFVISNNEALKDGHVAVVKKYAGNGAIVTIENSGGGANTIMSKRRPLYEPAPRCSPPEGTLPVRPDLYVLRLRAPSVAGCPLSAQTLLSDR